MLRLSFGSIPASSEFCLLSKVAFDLANNLIMNPHWDPDKVNDKLEKLIPAKDTVREELPFGIALPLDVIPPPPSHWP
eukprot:6057779-Ditylum_brightwellii.AAC.1